MNSEYQRDRINAQISQLKKEHEQLSHALTRAKRDEQFEVEKIRRNFKVRIEEMELRQQSILRETENCRRELHFIEQRIRTEQGPQKSMINEARERRLGRFK